MDVVPFDATEVISMNLVSHDAGVYEVINGRAGDRHRWWLFLLRRAAWAPREEGMSQSFGGGDATGRSERQTLLQDEEKSHTYEKQRREKQILKHHNNPSTRVSSQIADRSRRVPGCAAVWFQGILFPSGRSRRWDCPEASRPRWANRWAWQTQAVIRVLRFEALMWNIT